MAKKALEGFDILVDLAGKFVERQKGGWDHTAWLEFLSDVQRRGFELSDEIKADLGLVTESMKKFYTAVTAARGVENVMLRISDDTVNFVKKTRGVWDYSGWEGLLKEFHKKGLDLTEETVSYLGEILESVKGLYTVLPPPVSKRETKKTTGKANTTPKKKSTPLER